MDFEFIRVPATVFPISVFVCLLSLMNFSRFLRGSLPPSLRRTLIIRDLLQNQWKSSDYLGQLVFDTCNTTSSVIRKEDNHDL